MRCIDCGKHIPEAGGSLCQICEYSDGYAFGYARIMPDELPVELERQSQNWQNSYYDGLNDAAA